MKQNFNKKFISILLVISLIMPLGIFSTTVDALYNSQSTNKTITVAPINEAYEKYIANGSKGPAVSSLDLSYLQKSYALQSKQSRRNRANAIIPSTYDLRDYGKVSPVRNQGSYGTCWTFANLGSAESNLINQFPHISLSNLHLAWFSYTGNEEVEYSGEKKDPFNIGGYNQMAVATLAAWKGAVSSNTVPYNVTNIDESLRFASDYHLQDAYYLVNGAFNNGHEDLIYPDTTLYKQILMKNGAISFSYYHDNNDKYYNSDTYAYYYNTNTNDIVEANHAVLLVGWDDNFSKDNFNASLRPKNNGAWLLRNSWGTNYGDEGYFWISYEDTSIKLGQFNKLESNDNYARNYQYDTMGWGVSISNLTEQPSDISKKSEYCANVFTAQDDEQIEATAFYTTDANAKYEISIYTELKDPKNPTSGKQITTTQKGIEQYAGYHTIELDEAVPIKKGDKFSVVVKLTNPVFPFTIPAELVPLKFNQDKPTYMGNGNESYTSIDGVDWYDVAKSVVKNEDANLNYYVTNVCVKAFTNPVSTVSYSLLEGSVAIGEELKLTSLGADEIFYSIDGSDPTVSGIKYTSPFTIDNDMTVKTVAKTNSVFGSIKTKKYTKARSELVSMSARFSDGFKEFYDLSTGHTNFNMYIPINIDNFAIQAQGCDTITINGKIVKSSDYSENISLPIGQQTTVTVTSTANGKIPTDYTFFIYRSVLDYDFRAETIKFDENKYSLTDSANNPIKNGDVITKYISKGDDSKLRLIDNATNVEYNEYVPERPNTGVSSIDFINECTTAYYGDWNEMSIYPDMSNAKKCENKAISLTPGQNIYTRIYATDYNFNSETMMIVVPNRPNMPDNPGIDFKNETTINEIPPSIAYAFNQNGDDSAIGENKKVALIPNSSIWFIVCPTEISFASAPLKLDIPARPAHPTEIVFDKITVDSIALKPIENLEYKLNNGVWTNNPVFKNLKHKTEYTISARIAATAATFTSQQITKIVSTIGMPSILPSDYYFDVMFLDIHTDSPPIIQRYYFNDIGSFSRDKIVIPMGYKLANVPEIKSEDWLNPTALEFVNGRWAVSNTIVKIELEQLASIEKNPPLLNSPIPKTNDDFPIMQFIIFILSTTSAVVFVVIKKKKYYNSN